MGQYYLPRKLPDGANKVYGLVWSPYVAAKKIRQIQN